MKVSEQAWHEIVFVCPECGKEFKPESIRLDVRLCPNCSRRRTSEETISLKTL